MFFKVDKKLLKNKQAILSILVETYNYFCNTNNKQLLYTPCGAGGFILEYCQLTSQNLNRILTVIREGLVNNNDDAHDAAHLLDIMYRGNLIKVSQKENFQKKFREVLGDELIDKLNLGEALSACLIHESQLNNENSSQPQ